MSGPARRDPAWYHAVQIEVPAEGSKKGYKYLKCNYCSKSITRGVKRVKEHLAGTHKNVAACPQVPDEVKKTMADYFKEFEEAKHSKQRDFEEIVDGGSYYGGGGSSAPQHAGVEGKGSGLDSRGIRGPMDRYMINVEDDDKVLTPATTKEHRSRVCLDTGRFFFENAIPFNCVRSPSFVNMVRSIGNYGRGLKPPSMHEMRTWILEGELETTSKIVDEIRATWKLTGVSLLSDGWSDMRNRSLINFLVNNQHRIVFLKTVDASDMVKDANKLFQLLDEVVEEIGEEHVVQVITDNAAAYKVAGRLLMEKRTSLYWTPCAAHCIDLMLEKIGDLTQHKEVLIEAKRVTNFIHNHQYVLSMTREFAKKDLLRPAATRFATAYLTLGSMFELKQPLQEMFVSRKWAGCAWAKKDKGKAVKKIVMAEAFWDNVVYCIKTTKPLVDVLRVVDGERTPAMGFIYGPMEEAKAKIAKNLNDDLASYKEFWDIIDEKWERQLHRDLHAAVYYLNPQFRYSTNVSEHREIKRGLFNCMERMIKNEDQYLKVDLQLDYYTSKKGLFGSKASQATYQSRAPVDWWNHFGDDVPELKVFAMRVLGLTCSASVCERNWSTFNQVHTKKRNSLTTMKLNKLVYIMYNKRLKHRHLNKQKREVDEDPLIIYDIPSDDEWIANPNDGEDGSFSGDNNLDEEGRSSTLNKRKRSVGIVDEDIDELQEHIDEEEDEDSGDHDYYGER